MNFEKIAGVGYVLLNQYSNKTILEKEIQK